MVAGRWRPRSKILTTSIRAQAGRKTSNVTDNVMEQAVGGGLGSVVNTRNSPIPTRPSASTCEHIPVTLSRGRIYWPNKVNNQITKGSVIVATSLMTSNQRSSFCIQANHALADKGIDIGMQLVPPKASVKNSLYCTVSVRIT